MAKRKFVLSIGQSHATSVSDAASWEDQFPTVALRSPKVNVAQLPQFAEGVRETFTMPGTFVGGAQSGLFGDGPKASTWQTPDLSGKCVGAVRFLTFYNPCASLLNLGTSVTSAFPGRTSLGFFSTPTVLNTVMRWQYDPAGLVITRLRTGTQHTIQAGWAAPTNTITISPAMVPPPEVGEQISYVATAGASSSTTELKLVQAFGGLADVGSANDVPPYCLAASLHEVDFIRVRNSSGTDAAGRVMCRSRLGYVGAPVVFSVGTLPTGIVAGTTYYITRYAGVDEQLPVLGWTDTRAVGAWTPASDQITIAGHGLVSNEPVSLSGTLPPEVVSGTTYYVLVVDANTIQLRTTIGGAAHPFGAGGGAATLTRLAAVRITAHGLGFSEKVQLSGTLPSGVATSTNYYVYVSDHNTVLLSESTPASTPFTIVSSGGGAATVTRHESFSQFFIAASPGGTELVFDAFLVAANAMSFSVMFRGSLSGMRIRCLSSADPLNVGVSVPAGDIYMSSGKHTIQLGAALPAAPAAGDTFVIEVPPLDGQDVPFEKWALFLPWCPFEGRAPFTGPYPMVTGALAEVAGDPLFVQANGMDVWPKDALRFVNGAAAWGSAITTTKVRFGVTYYASAAALGAAFLATTYDGATIYGTVPAAASGGQSCYLLRQEGKSNPYPPGFNYPNHFTNLGDYQPFDGPGIIPAPKSTFISGLAVELADYYGETMYVVQLAVGGTNLGHTDVPPVAFGLGVNTFDPKRQLSWAPTGDVNNIFARLEEVLDAAVLAFRAQGDEGECVGVVWTQGEGDASFEHLANRYLRNGRRFRAAVREAIKSRGLFSRPANELKWLEPYCQTTPWPYNETVRAAKDVLVAEDPYSGLCELDDLPRLNSLPGTANNDPIHMTGAGTAELGRRLYGVWVSIGETNLDVDLANMALALLGEPAKVFSLDPAVDQSAQAAECAKFLPVAKEVILESHSWAFATKVVSLTPVATKDPLRTDWSFAYELPTDLLNALEVLTPGSTTSVAAPTAELTPWWRSPSASDTVYPNGHLYAIEPDAGGTLVLYTNVENAVLRYVKRITSSAAVPMKFKTAVARKLASLIAGQFVKGAAGAELAQRFDLMSRADMGDAASTDAKHRQNRPQSQNMPWNRE